MAMGQTRKRLRYVHAPMSMCMHVVMPSKCLQFSCLSCTHMARNINWTWILLDTCFYGSLPCMLGNKFNCHHSIALCDGHLKPCEYIQPQPSTCLCSWAFLFESVSGGITTYEARTHMPTITHDPNLKSLLPFKFKQEGSSEPKAVYCSVIAHLDGAEYALQ